MTETTPEKIYARYRSIRRISVREIQQMYAVFRQYYEHTDIRRS